MVKGGRAMDNLEILCVFFLTLAACFLWSYLPSGLAKFSCLIVAVTAGVAYGYNFDAGFSSAIWITIIFCLLFRLFRWLKKLIEKKELFEPILIMPISVVIFLTGIIGILEEGLINGILIGLASGLLAAIILSLVIAGTICTVIGFGNAK